VRDACVSLAQYLDQALKAANVPIVGVSIGDVADRATWNVQPAALQPQAQPVIDAFALPTAAQLLDDDALREVDVKALKALLIEIYPFLGVGKPTLVQLRANIIARFKALP
jgi:hypothetical protein